MKHKNSENERIKERIHDAFENATPDLMSSILADCETKKGRIIPMTNQKKFSGFKIWTVAAAACFVFLFVGLVGYFALNGDMAEKTVATKIMLDVNPSIDILVDEDENVLQVVPLNEDAEKIIGDMDVTNSSLEQTVDALIDSMIQNGYIDEIQNAVLVSVYSNDQAKAEAIKQKVAAKVSEQLGERGVVLSQTVSEDPETIYKLSQKYNITTGKCELINAILPFYPKLTFADLATASVYDLCLLFDSKNADGNFTIKGSIKKIVSQVEAINTTMEYYGVAKDRVTCVVTSVEFRRNRPVYNIILMSQTQEKYISYCCNIDMITGECIGIGYDSVEESKNYVEIDKESIDIFTAFQIACEDLNINPNETGGCFIIHYVAGNASNSQYEEDYWDVALNMGDIYIVCIDAKTGTVLSMKNNH